MRISAERTARPRREPQRTCLACRQVRSKHELIRLVRTADGTVHIDRTGKIEGRGAYLCSRAACWEKALRGKQLEHTFRTAVRPENREELVAQGMSLLKEMANDQRER